MMNCPNCKSAVLELMACDRCNTVGCVRCVTRSNRQWVCKSCRTGEPAHAAAAPKSEGGLFSMFG